MFTDKIVTHPLFSKGIDVWNSCKTEEQRKAAKNYIDLCSRSIAKECESLKEYDIFGKAHEIRLYCNALDWFNHYLGVRIELI